MLTLSIEKILIPAAVHTNLIFVIPSHDTWPGQGKGRKSGKSQSASPAEHSNIAFAATTKARETGTKEDHEHAAQMHARASDAHVVHRESSTTRRRAYEFDICYSQVINVYR